MVVSCLNDKVLSFSINAVKDVLPHNVNLFHWNKKDSKACPLCWNTQTLMHVLNNCPTRLNSNWYTWKSTQLRVLNNCPTSVNSNQYTWRHNSLLQAFGVFADIFMPESWNMTINLPEKFYSLPPGFEDYSLCPDLVVRNSSLKQVIIFLN